MQIHPLESQDKLQIEYLSSSDTDHPRGTSSVASLRSWQVGGHQVDSICGHRTEDDQVLGNWGHQAQPLNFLTSRQIGYLNFNDIKIYWKLLHQVVAVKSTKFLRLIKDKKQINWFTWITLL